MPALLAMAILVAVFLPAPLFAHEPVPRRLLRTIQIGVPQDISVEEIRKIAENDDTDYTTAILARSALLVLGQNESKLISYEELLDNLLAHLISDGTPFQPLASLPEFREKKRS